MTCNIIASTKKAFQQDACSPLVPILCASIATRCPHGGRYWSEQVRTGLQRLSPDITTRGSLSSEVPCTGWGGGLDACIMRSNASWVMDGTPCKQTDWHDWKHYLLVTSSAGVRRTWRMKIWCKYFSDFVAFFKNKNIIAIEPSFFLSCWKRSDW